MFIREPMFNRENMVFTKEHTVFMPFIRTVSSSIMHVVHTWICQSENFFLISSISSVMKSNNRN